MAVVLHRVVKNDHLAAIGYLWSFAALRLSVGPACRTLASHSPIVCGSRFSTSAIWAADQPSASSHTAC